MESDTFFSKKYLGCLRVVQIMLLDKSDPMLQK